MKLISLINWIAIAITMTSKPWAGESELQGLLQELCGHTGSVPTSKVKQIVGVCNKHVAEFKMVVYEIEKFVKKANNEDKLAGLFVIDSLVRQHAKERETFAKRFAIRMKDTLSHLLKISASDKATAARLLDEWRKKSVFPAELVSPALVELSAGAGGIQLAAARDTADDVTGKKRGAGSEIAVEQKKAVRLCPFREGNCPYGDKCRFNHHEVNTLEQYASKFSRFLASSSDPRLGRRADSDGLAVSVSDEQAEQLCHVLPEVAEDRIIRSDNGHPAFDPRFIDKVSEVRRPPSASSRPISFVVPADPPIPFGRKPGHLEMERLHTVNPDILNVPPPEGLCIAHDRFLDLYVRRDESTV